MDSTDIFRENLRLAVHASTLEVAETAKDEHRYKTRWGRLENAVDTSYTHDGIAGRVFLNTTVAPYGAYVHDGTSPHDIFPKKKQALRWVKGNAFIFAKRVHHPGWKADPFIYDALRKNEEKIMRIFERYVDRANKEVEHALTGG